MHELLVVARFAHYASLIGVFGGTAFRFYAFEGPVGSGEPGGELASVEFDAWLNRLVRGGALLALLSALALVSLTAAEMAGSAEAAIDPQTIIAVLTGTAFGGVWQWRLVLAAVLLAASFGRSGSRIGAIVPVLAGLLLASLALVGHAAMDDGSAKLGHQLADGLHLLAAGFWIGGLPPLLYLLEKSRTTLDPVWPGLTRVALSHFSMMGYVAVPVLALTGMVNAFLLVGNVEGLFGTPYGRLLLAKIVLFLLMVVAALINRFRLVPLLAVAKVKPYGLLWRSVLIEQAFGIAIVAVVSLLGTLPPAMHVSPP